MKLETLSAPYFAPAQQLYLAAFPLSERRDAQTWLPEDPHFRPGILTRDGQFLGILFYWEGPDFLYLEHFAITPQQRNGGLGAQALGLLRAPGKPIVLEIEPPVTDLTCRRKAFYCRNGFVPDTHQHIQPRYRPEDAPLPLELLCWPQSMTDRAWQRFEAFLAAHVACREAD